MGFLKPKAATSESSNKAYGQISGAYSPAMQTGNQATNFIGQLLGVNPMGGGGGGGSSGPDLEARTRQLLSYGGDSTGRAMRTFAAANPGMDAQKRFDQIYALADDSERGNFDRWSAENPTMTAAAGPGGNAGDAFEQYKAMAGFAPALRDMQKGIVGGAAAKGLLNSGASQKALVRGGQELNSGMFNNFLQQLSGLSGIGQNAGSLIANTGQTSKSQGGGPSTAGTIASTVGSIASIFSDRRTKRDITHLTDFEDGLGLYRFRYLGDDEFRVGVMADEVADIRPWALGPTVGGFQTVNYGAL